MMVEPIDAATLARAGPTEEVMDEAEEQEGRGGTVAGADASLGSPVVAPTPACRGGPFVPRANDMALVFTRDTKEGARVSLCAGCALASCAIDCTSTSGVSDDNDLESAAAASDALRAKSFPAAPAARRAAWSAPTTEPS